MNCPACRSPLEPIEAGDITVDVCKGGCGGLWFDQFELKKVDEAHESCGASLLEVERNPGIHVDHTQRRSCPKCPDTVMMRHFTSARREVEVDECPNCGGYWLDLEELGRLRSEFTTEADRKKAAADYFSQTFDGELAIMRAESIGRARTIRNLFDFFT